MRLVITPSLTSNGPLTSSAGLPGSRPAAQRQIAGPAQGADEIGDAAPLRQQPGRQIDLARELAAGRQRGNELLRARTRQLEVGPEHDVAVGAAPG